MTAVSDLEVDNEEEQGRSGDPLIRWRTVRVALVATTRPETMLDYGVAVIPKTNVIRSWETRAVAARRAGNSRRRRRIRGS